MTIRRICEAMRNVDSSVGHSTQTLNGSQPNEESKKSIESKLVTREDAQHASRYGKKHMQEVVQACVLQSVSNS